MLSRRLFCLCACAAPALSPTPLFAEECRLSSQAAQAEITPDAALALLKAGHARFLAGKPVHCDTAAQVKATASGQYPFAAVLGCIDSRVPPELVFDQRIGDMFTARVAGNCVNTDVLGSLEYATKVAGAKLIVVLGHSNCGAIKGAVDDVKLGHITALLEHFKPAVAAHKDFPGEHNSHNAALVQAVAETNVHDGVAQLTQRSQVLRELVGEGKVKIVPAMHDVASGQVTFL